jgi:hypothetical protein
MQRRFELALALGLGIMLGCAVTTTTVGRTAAQVKGAKVGVAGKAITIDVASRERTFVVFGRRQASPGAATSTVPLVQPLPHGLTRICTNTLSGPLILMEMVPALSFRNLAWNECTPQLCVDPGGFSGEFVDRTFRGEICGNGRDDADEDTLADEQDPDCQC